MSRIIVKNLPKQTTEHELKKHFSKKGNLTDVKLKYRDGEFRRFAFLGFENPQEAQEASQFFNGTYLKQSQITVEVCHDIGSNQILKSWSQKNKEKKEKTVKDKNQNDASLKESETTKKEKTKSKTKKTEDEAASLKEKLLEKYKNEPAFAEFLDAGEKGLKDDTKKKKKKKKSKESDSEGDEGIGIEQEEKISESFDSDSQDNGGDNEEEVKLAKKKDVSDMDYLKSLMKPSADVAITEAAKADGKPVETAKNKKEKKWQEFHTVVIRAQEMTKDKTTSRTFDKKNVKAFLKPLKVKSLRIPRQFRLVAYVGFKTEKEAKQAIQKDKSFLDGVRVQVLKYEKPTGNNGNRKGSSPWSVAEEKLKSSESVAESGKLFVRNLWYSVNEDHLRELFQQYGEISDVTLPICKVSRRPKGFATITFLFPEHAVAAVNALDGTNFKGRVLHILPAITQEEPTKESGNLSFKEQKVKDQKATAGSWHNWNTLFLGSAAVVDILADKYNRSKLEILNSEGKQSVAVNLALGEAQIVDETKRFLEDNGVSLEAFTTPGVQRSSTVMLVKNLPAKTTAQELSELFGRYGELGRVLLPSSGITCIVEYLDPGEAKQGFRGLAYSRFKYLPLYLEWAPIQTFKTPPPPPKPKTDDKDAETNSENVEHKKEQKTTNQDTEEKPAPEANTTVYVKNLNFSTDENILTQHFERAGPVHSVLIAKKRGLSQGYGFVQFIKKASADRAIRQLQDSLLDDHTLTIKFSEKTLTTKVASGRKIQEHGKQTSSKIMVKNIPFQAIHKEVKQLFATFGELKSVRLPDKPGSKEHRGFGFVEFITKEDARRAFETLSLSTHLYGRRLVLEWAKDDESVEELRKKTADRFLAAGPPKKRTKFEETITTGKGEESD